MNERVRYFDIAKGIAILCIIAGHMGNGIINNFVFTFHVPIFFLISGYFLKNNTSLKEFALKKYKQLIRPYMRLCNCGCHIKRYHSNKQSGVFSIRRKNLVYCLFVWKRNNRVYLSILYEADWCDMVSAGIFCGGYHCTILYGL